jgi:hypothetical protein
MSFGSSCLDFADASSALTKNWRTHHYNLSEINLFAEAMPLRADCLFAPWPRIRITSRQDQVLRLPFPRIEGSSAVSVCKKLNLYWLTVIRFYLLFPRHFLHQVPWSMELAPSKITPGEWPARSDWKWAFASEGARGLVPGLFPVRCPGKCTPSHPRQSSSGENPGRIFRQL